MFDNDYFGDPDYTYNDYDFESQIYEINNRYVIPKGTKTIEEVEEREVIGGVTILYTKSGNSYAEEQVDNIHTAFNYVVGSLK